LGGAEECRSSRRSVRHRLPAADSLLALFVRGVTEGFIHAANRRLVLQETDPERLLNLLASYTPPQVEKWIDRDES